MDESLTAQDAQQVAEQCAEDIDALEGYGHINEAQSMGLEKLVIALFGMAIKPTGIAMDEDSQPASIRMGAELERQSVALLIPVALLGEIKDDAQARTIAGQFLRDANGDDPATTH